jgi:hypothetical protein
VSADIEVMRIPISLPCQVPVLPGTPDTTADITNRTERCAVDGFWMVGVAIICDLHLRDLLGDSYETTCGDVALSPRETLPWAEMHRYDQTSAAPSWGTQS